MNQTKLSTEIKEQIKELEKKLKRQIREEEKQELKLKEESIKSAIEELNQFTTELLNKHDLKRSDLSLNEIKVKKTTSKMPPKPTHACLDDAGVMQKIIAKRTNFWKAKKEDFINEHEVTHRLLENNRWLFWNASLCKKPTWATDETEVNNED